MAYIGNNPFVGFAPFTIDTFVGDDTTITFTLSQPRPVNPRSILVVIDGVTQPAVSAYNLDGNLNLEFTEAPPQDSIITVVHMHLGTGTSSGGTGGTSIDDVVHPAEPFDDLTFDGTGGPFQLRHGGVAANPYNEYYTLIYVNGTFKRPLIDYTINTGGQITFVGTPPGVGNSFYGLEFGKISITEVADGSLDGDAFSGSVDFGSRDVRIDSPNIDRQLANKEYVDSQITDRLIYSTTDLPEGDNLYFTYQRVRDSLTPADYITYDSLTGTIGITLPSFLAGINQNLGTTSSPTFVDVEATSVTADLFTGDIVGNVTGNVLGDVTGQVTDISNHFTDELLEGVGATNLWFTDLRAQNAIESVWVHPNHIGCEVFRDGLSGEYRIRVIVGGTHTEVITNITQANPCVVETGTPHGFIDGDFVTITDVSGMTELNGNSYYLNVLTSTTVALYTDILLTTPVDSTEYLITVSNVTQANPAVLTTDSDHGLTDGTIVTISGIVGMTELNGNSYYAKVTSPTDIELYTNLALTTGVDSTGYTAYASDGQIVYGYHAYTGDGYLTG